MTNPMEAAQIMLWVALGLIASVALVTGGVVFWLTDSGIAGLSALLLVAAAGLFLLRYA